MLTHPAHTRSDAAQVWSHKQIARDFFRQHTHTRKSKARLRVGYISSDFVNHPTADLIQSALLLHDRTKFEVYAYSITKDDDSDYRRRLATELEHFQTLRSSHSDRRCCSDRDSSPQRHFSLLQHFGDVTGCA